MRVRSISFENWLCYAGEHKLDLAAKAYAVLAHDIRNSESSNWRGKTGFLEAIRFALSGWHRHRLDDAWITNGEKQGGVVLTLEDGTTISRMRKRGKATQLTVSGAKKEDAQRAIDELIGLTERDFLATCYFEQGQMSRFITQEASHRTETVSAWFQLEPLLAVEEIHKTKLSELTWSATTLRQSLEATDDLERSELAGFESFEALVDERAKMTKKLEEVREELATARKKLQDNRAAIANDLKREEYDRIVEEGTKLREMVDKIDQDDVAKRREKAEDAVRQAAGIRVAASNDLEQKRKAVSGHFDGRCPVANIPCPAKKEITKHCTDNQEIYSAAQLKFREAHDAESKVTQVRTKADADFQALERANERLRVLRERGNVLLGEIDDDLDSGDETLTQDTIDKLLVRSNDLFAKLAVYERSIAAIEKARGERLRLAQQLSAIEVAITTEREAKAIVGRNGAQRRIAEASLTQIEKGANQMLQDCAIDLQVAVQWSREGTTIASACEECGHPFPKTQRVKHCERCSAPRGMNIINKLNIELSNVSGAAKDLAGAAFQLSASRWMRTHRKARWSVAVLDEPFGQLDVANRKAFSQHLAALLRSRYGFEQSFTVAHHSAVLDALPGRIEIESDGKRSTIKVVA